MRTPTPTPTLTPTPTPEPAKEPPAADFRAEPLIGIAPLEVKFIDLSTNRPSSWVWEFGDGDKSNAQNPTHIYKNKGVYSVKLTASNSAGKNSTEKPGLIEVTERGILDADFDVDKSSGFVPLTVKFTDTSTGSPSSWIWEFGDGGISDKQNPGHEYLTAGLYSVSLTVSRQGGESDSEKKANLINAVQNTPVADFSASVTAGQSPLKVEFTDLSQPVGNIKSWVWDFSDGATETAQNPEHTYNIEGFYTVGLTVSNPAGADSEIKTNLITVKGQNVPVADFITNKSVGLAPFTVQFFDQSEPSGKIASWIWEFGDGGISSSQHPTHIYQTEGIFTATLTVSNSFGADSEVKPNLVAITGTDEAVLAGFSTDNNVGVLPFNVRFINNSAGKAEGFTWKFGDGAVSSEREPGHLYEKAGEFDVSLSVKGASSADTRKEEKFIKIINREDVAAWFTASPLTGNGPLEVQFVDRSVGDVAGWLWDFGDEKASTLQNPKHVYTEKGKFTVSVAVSGKSGTSNVKKMEDLIEVLEIVLPTPTPETAGTPQPANTPEPLRADFGAEQVKGEAPFEAVFSDISTGNPVKWLWDFGDGGTSGKQNPAHTYVDEGMFSVRLTVSNDSGENDSLTKDDFITVTAPAGGGDECVATALLEDGKDKGVNAAAVHDKLNLLRWFRDNVLSMSKTGVKLIKYYYEFSSEVKDIINSDPDLRTKAIEIVNDLMPVIKSSLKHDSVKKIVNESIHPGLDSKINTLLDEIAEQGSDGLRKAVSDSRELLYKK